MRVPAGFAALAAVLAACPAAPAPRPPGPRPVVAGVIDVAPFGFARDDGPDRALLLGTAPGARATVVPLPAGTRQVTVDAGFARRQDGGVVAGVVALVLTAARSEATRTSGPARGPAALIAAQVAADVLGKDVGRYAFTVTGAGAVDDPAAAALLAAGFLAALLGRPLAADVTLCGTLLPDGTIGPVAHLPWFIGVTADRGKRRLGVPRGQLAIVDPLTGDVGDLRRSAGARGLELVELGDIHDALALLTGAGVPRPLAVDEAAMAVPAALGPGLAVQYARWQQLLAASWPRVLTLSTSRAVPAAIAQTAQHAIEELAAAEVARGTGGDAVALDRVVRAWTAATIATTAAEVVARVRAGRLDDAALALDELAALADATDAGLTGLGGAAPRAPAAHLYLIAAFEHAIAGWAARAAAARDELPRARTLLTSLAAAPPDVLARTDTAEQIALTALPAIALLAGAVADGTRAAAILALDPALAAPPRAASGDHAAPATVSTLARGFRTAAAASLADLDARPRVAADDPDAPVAPALAELVARAATRLAAADDPPAALARSPSFTLAAAYLAYRRSAELVAAAAAPAGDDALASQLIAAARRAREHARVAEVATGAIPALAQLHYAVAQDRRTGDPAAQREALAAYRAASAASQLAIMLARP